MTLSEMKQQMARGAELINEGLASAAAHTVKLEELKELLERASGAKTKGGKSKKRSAPKGDESDNAKKPRKLTLFNEFMRAQLPKIKACPCSVATRRLFDPSVRRKPTPEWTTRPHSKRRLRRGRITPTTPSAKSLRHADLKCWGGLLFPICRPR